MFGSLLLEYNGADDEGIPYDGGEGGYQAPILDTLDILIDEGVAHDQRLLDDLNSVWNGQPWVRRDVWALSEQEALGYGWERFREIVIHERRYWFVLAKADPYEPQAIAPDRMLPAVGEAMESAGVVHHVPFTGTSALFRAQTHRPGEVLAGADRLGAPPVGFAASNRMSPAGISVFYAAEASETAITEVRAAETDESRALVTVGGFEALRDLTIVDLCDMPEMPGLFDAERAHTRGALAFLKSFAAQLAEPVRRDGLEHVEYVPTQVFSEWLRYEFRPSGESVDGVRYRSSRGPGACVALFFGPGSAVDAGEEPLNDQPLRLTDTVPSAPGT